MIIAQSARRLLRRILHRHGGIQGESWLADKKVVRAFVANPEHTFIVSFPRTGSHWLRMLMELYFERPSLRRVFYYPERTDYLAYHTHDLDLDVERWDVIYLYRDPVNTVFSQLAYQEEPLDDAERIAYWADLYGQHLDKWLHKERFARHKTILTYAGLRDNLPGEFAKVTAHFSQTLDAHKLEQAAAQVSKAEVKRKTEHDPHVIQLQQQYAEQRQRFRETQSEAVWAALRMGRPYLLAKGG